MFEELNLGYCSSLNLTKSSFIAKGTTRNQLALLPEVQTVTTWTSNSESGGLLPLLVFLQNVSNKQKKKSELPKNGAVADRSRRLCWVLKRPLLPHKVSKQCFPKHEQENRRNRYLWANATPLMQKWNYESRL